MRSYYHDGDMWIQRSHVFAPLACLTSKDTKWQWGPMEQLAFNNIKRAVTQEVLLTHPDCNDSFEVCSDDGCLSLAVRCSDNMQRKADSFLRKLNDAQQKHLTTACELFATVETLKEFHTALLGQKLSVLADPKTLEDFFALQH
jgi:hypothetical protein